MIDHFPAFAKAVRKQFDTLAQGQLFVVATDRDGIWAHYLAAFPQGSNPLFRERTQHDCSCCRHFIRSIGDVVAIQNGKVVTVWDIPGLPHPYDSVAEAMAEYVREHPVCDVFLTPAQYHGIAENRELRDGKTLTWTHFAVTVPTVFVTRDHAEKRGNAKTTHAVLLRGLRELSPAALATVKGLIADNAIYRGAEFKRGVEEFAKLQAKVQGVNDPTVQELLAWQMVDKPVARFRNTAICTLVQDLSEGVAEDEAVRMFEAKVAPLNYKRPTAVITRSMVTAATKTIEELGLEPALERRHARLSDVSVNAVQFVDNAVQGEMKGGLKGLLMEEVQPVKFDAARATEIGIDDFVRVVLPRATGLKVHLENAHLSNFMSLTAPVHEDAPALFKWDNNFAWSYAGNAADSIKERVKRAGGRVEDVALRVSLAWYNYDDLDLHCRTPKEVHIYYGNKMGTLDVDMNAGSGQTRTPVENMRWVNLTQDGNFEFYVNQFSKRESVDVGFEVEIETAGGITALQYPKALGQNQSLTVATISVNKGLAVIKPAAGLTVGYRSHEKWGLKTQQLHRVNAMVLSPNHWDDNIVGAKHWFFLLEGCKNPDPTRGIYNEFLSHSLEKHRKVFEVLGDKTKCPVADEQLSGLGFTSARGDRVTVAATGPGLNKVYTIVF